jgi:hypothetical protein
MKYFGANPSAICSELEKIDAPNCAPCGHCKEPILRSDAGFAVPCLGEPLLIAYHRACFLRGIFGSVAHQKKQCSCYGGSGEDDPNLTRREAAEAAVNLFEGRKNAKS